MRRKNPVDVIENYRRGQQRRFPFTWTDILMALLVLAFLLLIGYITFIAKPEIPAFLSFNTLTPTIPCDCQDTPPDYTTPPTAPALDVLPAASATAHSTATDQPTLAAATAPTKPALPTATSTATLTPTETAIPTETLTPTATPLTTFDYTVQDGDTLSTIADRYGLTVAEVMTVNPDLKDPSYIYVGQKIKIPIK